MDELLEHDTTIEVDSPNFNVLCTCGVGVVVDSRRDALLLLKLHHEAIT